MKDSNYLAEKGKEDKRDFIKKIYVTGFQWIVRDHESPV